jgi:tagatose-1,6-bisphosphate aldolase non-catalytic subunit AgaZ/GatZ
MNKELRRKATDANLSLLDYIVKRLDALEEETQVKRTLFAACPNSLSVLKAALLSAKRCNAPVLFAATLNQVDTDGGYTGFTAKEFVDTLREESRIINFNGPVIIAIDHGGPWLKDKHRLDKLSYNDTC